MLQNKVKTPEEKSCSSYFSQVHSFTLKLEPIDVNFVDFVSSEGGKRLETNEHLESCNKT
jgi:hypothetical protein